MTLKRANWGGAVCAWCHCEFDSQGNPIQKVSNEEYKLPEVSHGICNQCLNIQLNLMKKSKLNLRKTTSNIPYTYQFDIGIGIPDNVTPTIIGTEELQYEHPGLEDMVSSAQDEIIHILGPNAEEISGGGGFGFADFQINVPNLTEDQAEDLREKIVKFLTALGLIENAKKGPRFYVGAWNYDDPEQYADDANDQIENREFDLPGNMPPGMASKLNLRKAKVIDNPQQNLSSNILEAKSYVADRLWNLLNIQHDLQVSIADGYYTYEIAPGHVAFNMGNNEILNLFHTAYFEWLNQDAPDNIKADSNAQAMIYEDISKAFQEGYA
jgi:hypothetical protein